jgi:hypothetical protein
MNIYTNEVMTNNNNNAFFAESLLDAEEIDNLLAEIESSTRIATLTEIVKSAQELGLFNSVIRDAVKTKKAKLSEAGPKKEIDPRRYGYKEDEVYGNGWQDSEDSDVEQFCYMAKSNGILSVNCDSGSVFLKDVETYILSPAKQAKIKACECEADCTDDATDEDEGCTVY